MTWTLCEIGIINRFRVLWIINVLNLRLLVLWHCESRGIVSFWKMKWSRGVIWIRILEIMWKLWWCLSCSGFETHCGEYIRARLKLCPLACFWWFVFSDFKSVFVRILEYLRDCVKLCQCFEIVYDYDHFELPWRFHNFRVFDNFKASL